MQEKTIKVGDRIAWQDVPDGALVRDEAKDYAIRINDEGTWVSGEDWCGWKDRTGSWSWAQRDDDPCTLIAFGVTEDTTGNELHAYAEAFDRTCVEAHAKADALRTAVAEIEAETDNCRATVDARRRMSAGDFDYETTVEMETRADALKWALDALRKTGAL